MINVISKVMSIKNRSEFSDFKYVFNQKDLTLKRMQSKSVITALIIFFICVFLGTYSSAQAATINWNVSATATETLSSSGSGSANARDTSSNCAIGSEMPSPYSGCYTMEPISSQYSATGSCSYSMSTGGSGNPYAIARLATCASVPNNCSRAEAPPCSGSCSRSGSFSFSLSAGQTYYLYAFHRGGNGSTSMNCSWNGSTTNNITGQDNGNPSFSLSVGEKSVDSYNIQWNNSQGGSRSITSFTFSSSFSPSYLEPRLSSREDPTYSQSGSIKVTFDNTQPSTGLTSPVNQAGIEDNTPNFQFTYSDSHNDNQQAFQLQISTNSSFQNIVFDTGRIVSGATSYQLSSSNQLPPGGPYYWRVRTSDIYAGSSEWGSFSPTWSFTNTQTPDITLKDGSTELPGGGGYVFPDVDRGELADASLTIANDGSAALQIDTISLDTNETYFVTAPTSFPVVLQPGQSTQLGLRFVPAETGQHSAILNIASNDPDENPFILNLSGRGIDWAFRYKQYLYSRDGEYIYGKLENMSQYWGDAERAEALLRINEYTQNLQADPSSSGLRWALLDVYYDIAVAELMLAQEKTIGALQSSLGVNPQLGPAINQEITLLEEARNLHEKGLKIYFDLMQDSLGIDTATVDSSVTGDMPFGYYIFSREVPGRSLLSPLRRNAQGDYILPGEPETGSLPVEVHNGYKDLMLLIQLEKEYVRTAARQAKLYLLSTFSEGSGSSTEASNLVGEVLISSYTEVEVLLNSFGINLSEGPWDSLPSGMEESVTAWRNAMSELTHYQTYLAGETDPLGFPDDILVLMQSKIPGSSSWEYFDSYDFLADYLTNQTAAGPLAIANANWTIAMTQYQNYRDRLDQLASHLSQSRLQFNERLRQIVGVNYGDLGYDDPDGNPGSELALQHLHIQLAQTRLASLKEQIEGVNTLIADEITRRGQARGINDAMRQVYIKYGDSGALVMEEMASISSSQSYLQNSEHPRRSEISNLEGLRGLRQAGLQRLAAEEKAEISTVTEGLLDLESSALIKNLILQMQAFYLDSIEAAIEIEIEQGKLDALLAEKVSLELLWTEYNEDLADRYFADPSHRLMKDISFVKAELSFQLAQQWLLLTAKALEYKWNTPFRHVYSDREYTPNSVFALRNAQELTGMFNAMADWNISISVGDRNDDNYKKFSFRRDFLDLGDNFQAFQNYLSTEADILEADDPENKMSVRALRLKFSTVREAALFFRQERWLEKINFMRVKVLGGVLSGLDAFIDGYLIYGGTSYIRNRTPGIQDPEQADLISGEMTAYPVRYLYFDSVVGSWQSKDNLGSYIAAQVTRDPDVPDGAYQIDTFKELSVASSDWSLFIALENPDGDPVLNLSEVVDIEIHFAFYWHNRQ